MKKIAPLLKNLFSPPLLTPWPKSRQLALLHFNLLITMLIAGVIWCFQLAWGTPFSSLPALLNLGLIGGALFLLYLVRRGHIRIPGLWLIGGLWLTFVLLAYLGGGIRGESYAANLILIVLASLVFGTGAAIFMAGLTILTGVVLVVLETNGLLPSADPMVPLEMSLISYGMEALAIAALLYFSGQYLEQLYERYMQNQRKLFKTNQALKTAHQNLEQQLQGQSHHLEVLQMLSDRFVDTLDTAHLFSQLVNTVQEQFGFYSVQIYLMDEMNSELKLVQGTGEVGEQLKAQGYFLSLTRSRSLIVLAARNARLIKVDDVYESPDWLSNPLLPDTRSEIVVPILRGSQVIGVLDVQSDKLAGFTPDDELLLQTLTNYTALTMHNAHLFEEVQTRLTEARSYQQRYVEQSWDRQRISRRSNGKAQFSLGESTTLRKEEVSRLRQQITQAKQPLHVADDEHNETAWAAPIRLNQVIIGNLQFHGLPANHQWTEGELALIIAVLDQVAQSAESLRLVEDLQERASRERLLGQISDKLRRAPDIDSLMNITITELSRVLRPKRTFVRLDSAATEDEDGNTQS